MNNERIDNQFDIEKVSRALITEIHYQFYDNNSSSEKGLASEST